MNALYNRIKNFCDIEGITITEMCRRANVARGNLTDLKNGRQNSLSAPNLIKIAGLFNISVETLLGETNEKSPVSTMADEANVDYLLSKMSLSELAELAVKVATEMKERGLE